MSERVSILCDVCRERRSVVKPGGGRATSVCDDCRDWMQRAHEKGATRPDIAEATGCTESAVWWLIHKDPRATPFKHDPRTMSIQEYADHTGAPYRRVGEWRFTGKVVVSGLRIVVQASDEALRAAGLLPDQWETEKPCKSCLRPFTPKDSRSLYCSRRCQDRVTASIRRSRRRNAGSLRVDMAYLYNRDGGVCGICGERVDRRCKYPHPKAPSPDHIIPLSKGGEDTYRNLQLAHWGCNDRKNAGSAGSQLRLIG